MSVLIRGMDMPKNCDECIVNCDVFTFTDKRSPDCPLVDVPTPHGRLIDADAIQDYNVETFGQRLLIIDTAPTVIEAEGET